MKVKKLCTLLLALLMVFSMLTVASAAPEDETATIKVAVFSMAAEDESLLKSAVNTWFAENDVIVEGKNVTKAQIVAGELENYDLLLIGAGGGGAVGTALGADGGAAVEEYVAAGGGYVGFAGGSYAAGVGYSDATKNLELINLLADQDPWSHGQGQLLVQAKVSNIISNGMRLDRKYIAYGINPAVLTPGESDDPNMGEVVNVVSYISNPTNNVPVGTDLSDVIDMTGTPAVACASYGEGRVTISGIQPHLAKQPVEMNFLLGQMVLYAAGYDEAEVTPVSAPQEQFDIVGEWLWSSDLRSASEEQNQLMFDRFEEMGVTDIYLLVKGTNGTVAFNKTETALQKDDPDRDILEEAIELAHARGIRLHAWITSANDKAYKTAYPDEGLYHFVRGRDNDIVNIASENFIQYMEALMTELAENYEIDGLHFDYIRYNHICNGWGPEDIAELEERGADVDHLKELINETFYTGAMDQVTIFKALADGDKDVMKFAQMRRDNVVNFATRLTEAVRAVNPDLIISAALMPEGAYSGDYNVSGMDSVSFADLHYGQNYKDAADLYDYIVPMEYSDSFAADPQWTAALAVNAANMGNKVVVGFQSFSPATSQSLMGDVEAIRALLPNENILGICHFRTTQFNYAKTTVDPARSLLQVKAMNGRTTFEMKSVELDLLDGLKATEVILGDSLEGAKTEISADGKHVTVTAADGSLLKALEEGEIFLRTEGTLNETTGPVFLRMIGTDGNDSRTYQIYETGSVRLPGEPERSGEKEIISFSIDGTAGIIDGDSISLTLPAGTDVTKLVPSIEISKAASVSPASGAAIDFSKPVEFTVTAEDGTTRTYIVTVTVETPSEEPSKEPSEEPSEKPGESSGGDGPATGDSGSAGLFFTLLLAVSAMGAAYAAGVKMKKRSN